MKMMTPTTRPLVVVITIGVVMCIAAAMVGIVPVPVYGASRDYCNDPFNQYGDIGDFDSYVFEQTWTAQFCEADKKHDLPGCVNPSPFMRQHLTIHGLWPNYDGGRHPRGIYGPQCCIDTPHSLRVNPNVINAFWDDLVQLWPDTKQLAPSHPYRGSFWEYEWRKHGTCDGSGQASYFGNVLQTVYPQVPTPTIIRANIGGTVDKSELQAAYNKQVKLVCDQNYWLKAVQSCFDRNYNWIDCTISAKEDRSCGDTIGIRAFTSS